MIDRVQVFVTSDAHQWWACVVERWVLRGVLADFGQVGVTNNAGDGRSRRAVAGVGGGRDELDLAHRT